MVSVVGVMETELDGCEVGDEIITLGGVRCKAWVNGEGRKRD